MIRFKYQKEWGAIGEIYRPVADIEFKAKGREWIECHPYIDSGADVTLIPLSLGRLLGFEVVESKIKELYGLGKQAVPVIFQNVEAKIGKYTIVVEIGWALIEEVSPLLGRKDIFDHFHVNFKQDKRLIEFQWIKKQVKV